jgi:hypothetical protein
VRFFLAAPAFLALMMLASSQTTAAEITHTLSNGENIITVSGEIKEFDDVEFIKLAGDIQKLTVSLNSPGGSNLAAAKIGMFVRAHRYETMVKNGATCSSACTLIWLAGSSRHLGHDARLGFHSASMITGGQREEGGNHKVREYLRYLDTPQKVIDLARKADPNSMSYINYAQAKAWGLLGPVKQRQNRPKVNPLCRWDMWSEKFVDCE